MSDLGTVDRLLLRAAAADEITYDVNMRLGFAMAGVEVDYDCHARLWTLIRWGYLGVDEEADRAPVTVTGAGRKALS